MKKILIKLLFLFLICFPVNSEIKILPIIEGNIDSKILGNAADFSEIRKHFFWIWDICRWVREGERQGRQPPPESRLLCQEEMRGISWILRFLCLLVASVSRWSSPRWTQKPDVVRIVFEFSLKVNRANQNKFIKLLNSM